MANILGNICHCFKGGGRSLLKFVDLLIDLAKNRDIALEVSTGLVDRLGEHLHRSNDRLNRFADPIHRFRTIDDTLGRFGNLGLNRRRTRNHHVDTRDRLPDGIGLIDGFFGDLI